MKNSIQIKLLKVLILLFIALFIMSAKVFASTLNIRLDTDKDTYKTNEEIKVRVSWSQNMQAAGFTLKYDSTKLEFVSASIGNSFYNSDTKGEIRVNWASFNEEDTKNIDFIFKAKDVGKGSLRISDPRAFATGNLEIPTDYNIEDDGLKTITIKENTQNEEPQNEEPQNEEPQNEDPQNEEPQNEEPQNEQPQNDKPLSGKTENTTEQNNQNSQSSQTSKNNETTKKLPYTGSKNTIAIALVVMSILSIVFYKKYKNLSNI